MHTLPLPQPTRLSMVFPLAILALFALGWTFLLQHTTPKATPTVVASLSDPQLLVQQASPKSASSTKPATIRATISPEPLFAANVSTVSSVNAEAPQLKLKMTRAITSITFPPGGITPSAEAKLALQTFADAHTDAAKIHIVGYSGGRSYPQSERSKTALNRAFAVKIALVEAGVEPQKLRLFYHSNDHYGQPRAEYEAFSNRAEADLDASMRLQR
jgi:outer membrane protein OmpA-like peptidoglycan-associated protein